MTNICKLYLLRDFKKEGIFKDLRKRSFFFYFAKPLRHFMCQNMFGTDRIKYLVKNFIMNYYYSVFYVKL